jgi:hypothetical protein
VFEKKPKLRDRRQPGRFWADNEIIDVFGDDLGSHGILLYLTMARYAFGNVDVKMSLRDLAGAARMSKTTGARLAPRGGSSRSNAPRLLFDCLRICQGLQFEVCVRKYGSKLELATESVNILAEGAQQ